MCLLCLAAFTDKRGMKGFLARITMKRRKRFIDELEEA